MGTVSANDNSFECALKAWREHESELLAYLVRRLSDKHLADDLLQECSSKH
jgi:DNA-directed RNA polymerase specialized sigma24 family protein